MAQLAGLANASSYAAGSSSLTGAGAMRVAGLGTLQLYATMQGQRAVTQDLFVLSTIIPAMIRAVVPYFGVVLAETAKEIHLPHIDTQATYNSIKADGYTVIPGGAAIDVSVSTPQAKFLEFGFVHHLSGNWIHNPFMIPAADAVTPYFVDAIQQIAGVAVGGRFLSGPVATSPAAGILASTRGLLYSYSKFAGDIQVLGFSGLSASRGYAVKGAKGIGNIQAIQGGTLSGRAARLLGGRVGGAALRGGSFGGGILSGSSGRIYNRISGRALGGSLSNIR